MKDQFELAGGSVIGREHLRVGKNNQDAYFWSVTDAGIVAVVCDGCSGAIHSEVGAKLGARMAVTTIQAFLKKHSPLHREVFYQDSVWKSVQHSLLDQLGEVAVFLGGDRSTAVRNYLLFTMVGVVITPVTTAVFALGDGVIAINEELIHLGPFSNNAPPYLAYGLMEEMDATAFNLKTVHAIPTAHVQSLLIGTDGVNDVVQAAEQPLPGRSETVGKLTQFWQDDRYFHNPDQVRRRLTLMNHTATTIDMQTQQSIRHSGLLPDDTTLIVIRRKEDSC